MHAARAECAECAAGRSRKEKARSGSESRYGDDWDLRAGGRAFFLGDVPPEGELARLALGQVWEPMIRTLRDLDQREPRELPGRSP